MSVLILAVCFLCGIFASTKLELVYVEDTIFESSSNPYIFGKDQNTVTVKEGATLTIEPGVEIQLCDDCTIMVYGKLVSKGRKEKEERIIFTGVEKIPGFWNLIYLSGSDHSIEYTTFEYGGSTGSDGGLLYVVDEEDGSKPSGTLSIKNSDFLNSEAGPGIRSRGIGLDIKECNFKKSGGGISTDSAVDVHSSRFENLDGTGISFYSSSDDKPPTFTSVISQTFFTDCGRGISFQSIEDLQIKSNTFTNIKGKAITTSKSYSSRDDSAPEKNDYNYLVQGNKLKCCRDMMGLSSDGILEVTSNEFLSCSGSVYIDGSQVQFEGNAFYNNTAMNGQWEWYHDSEQPKSLLEFSGTNATFLRNDFYDNNFIYTPDMKTMVNKKIDRFDNDMYRPVLLEIKEGTKVSVIGNNFKSPKFVLSMRIGSKIEVMQPVLLEQNYFYDCEPNYNCILDGNKDKSRQEAQIVHPNTNEPTIDRARYVANCLTPRYTQCNGIDYYRIEEVCSGHGTCVAQDNCRCEGKRVNGKYEQWRGDNCEMDEETYKSKKLEGDEEELVTFTNGWIASHWYLTLFFVFVAGCCFLCNFACTCCCGNVFCCRCYRNCDRRTIMRRVKKERARMEVSRINETEKELDELVLGTTEDEGIMNTPRGSMNIEKDEEEEVIRGEEEKKKETTDADLMMAENVDSMFTLENEDQINEQLLGQE